MPVVRLNKVGLIAALVISAPSVTANNLSPATTTTAPAPAPTTTNHAGLNTAAKALGKLWFGTGADIPGSNEVNDQYYMEQFRNISDFGGATPANVMKYDYTEPQQGAFDFTLGDQFVKIAKSSGKLVRCHNLIWHFQLPNWVTSPSTPWTNATLSAVLVNHVQSLVEHFGDQCYSWDVVNEAFADSPAGAYRPSIWYTTIGPEYIPMAFKAAQAVVEKNKLKVKLYYNDYSIEYSGPKSTAAQNLVKQLKARQIQIDGVGLQSHFIVGEAPSQSSQESNMHAFIALDVEVAVTEHDVRLTTLPPTAALEAQQVTDYHNTVAACVNVKRCIGVTVWDFDDTYSWIPSTYPGQGYADLWYQPGGPNTPLARKAAYEGCLRALTSQKRPAPSPSTSSGSAMTEEQRLSHSAFPVFYMWGISEMLQTCLLLLP